MATKKSAQSIEHDGAPTLDKGLTEVPVANPVGEYAERPYHEAISDEHRAELKAAGVHVDKKTTSEQDAVAVVG